jgi:hypothetical protein
MAEAKQVDIAIPSYARLVKKYAPRTGHCTLPNHRDDIAVFVPDAFAIWKLELVGPVKLSNNLLVLTGHPDGREDGEKAMMEQLRKVFRQNPFLKQMASELVLARYCVSESTVIRGVHFSSVTLQERRKMCEAMLPRLISISKHMEAARLEYEQLYRDFKLERTVFDPETLSFEEWNDSEIFDCESLPTKMSEYMQELGGQYDASPAVASKKAKTSE